MDYIIRKAQPEDAKGIIESHIRSIREVCSTDYNPLQIAAWSGIDFKESVWHETMIKDHVWVVDVLGVIHGFGHLRLFTNESSELRGLYLSPDVIGFGIGKEMVSIIKNEAAKNKKTTILLSSTKTAKPFYVSVGFQTSDGIQMIKINGEQIECYPMVYKFI